MTMNKVSAVNRLASIIAVIILASTPGSAQVERAPLTKHLIGRAGICLPAGDFGATNIHATNGLGYAQTGYSLGIEFTSEAVKGFQLGFSGGYSVNSVDQETLQKDVDQAVGANVTIKADSYSAIDLLAGGGFLSDVSPEVTIHGLFHAGLLLATFPEITSSYGGNYATQKSSSATAIQYGFSFGMTIVNRYDINVRYLTAEPEFTFGSGSSSGKTKQPMGRVEATVGFVFF